ncbi:TetR/AcrR family transcriptional regulator [Pseudolysinimonas yzui]|uniref:Transcriptional regulator n=1 Tax=Pseudolysinimonas yzui TaxID=2708254 RepID=A0A8J3DU07_9MICO|nr:TetR/AcrR family transcriptional regulator [Pseudolysinimonas yzui]GHF05411.1 transcriptional regulator [Pseudolysinimonas yzui]
MVQPRPHGARTKRDAILDAAVDLLLAHGYDGTSMDAVAARAGVSKTTVYAHFDHKDALFRAVMEHATAVLVPNINDAIAAAEHDPIERLKLAMIAVVQSAIAPELIAFFRVLISEHGRREQFAGVIEQARRDAGAPDVVSILAPLLHAAGVSRGVEVVDPEQWVIVLLRLSAPTIQFDILTSAFTPSPQLIETHVRLVVGVFLDGALPAGARRAVLPEGYATYPWGPAFER